MDTICPLRHYLLFYKQMKNTCLYQCKKAHACYLSSVSLCVILVELVDVEFYNLKPIYYVWNFLVDIIDSLLHHT